MPTKKNIFWVLLFLFIFLFISYGQTLKMNFWRDDYSMLFKLQHPFEKAAHFGNNGLIGSGPYKYILLPHALFFPVFKLNPTGYFIVGLMIYAVAMYTVFLFVNEFLNNKKAAIFSSLVFAAGHISSDGLFRVINSWQNSNSQILTLLTLYSFMKYLNKKNLKYYLLSVVFYLISIEFIFVRSQSLIFLIITIDFLVSVFPNIKKNILSFFIRQIPFLVLFKLWYLRADQIGADQVKNSLVSVFINGHFGELTPFFANIGNVLIPDRLQTQIISIITKLFLRGESVNDQIFWVNVLIVISCFLLVCLINRLAGLSKKHSLIPGISLLAVFLINQLFVSANYYWYTDIQSVSSGMTGMAASILCIYIFFIFEKRNRKIGSLVLLGWATIMFQLFSYFLLYKDAILETSHRYFSGAFIGYCLLMGGLLLVFTWRKEKAGLKLINYLALAGLLIMVLVNLGLNINRQKKFVREISIPSKRFYQQLKSEVPSFEKNSLFYFDIVGGSFYQHQFDEFFSVGSMPNATSIAVYYGIDRYDFSLTSDYNELLSKIAKNELPIKQIYSFTYGKEGLINTTKQLRELLTNGGGQTEMMQSPINFINKTTVQNQFNLLTPLSLVVDVNVQPYFDLLFSESNGKLLDSESYSLKEKLEVIDYLKNKKRYYQLARATALSEWQYQKAGNILDGNPETSWRGNRLYWHDNTKDEITVDLGSQKQISKVIWVNVSHYFSPLSYKISTSLDNILWTTVKSIENGQERKDGETVVEAFPPIGARYVKISVYKTVTDDSPAIAEIEVIESKYSEVEVTSTSEIVSNLFSGIKVNEISPLYNAFMPLAEIVISINSDKGKLNEVARIPVIMGKRAVYETIIPSFGYKGSDITIEVRNIPSLINIYHLKVRNLNFSEINKRGLIKIYD